MLKGFKYRLYPTDFQKELINKHIGCFRFVYNLALETKISAYLGVKHNYSAFDLISQLPELKKDCTWLCEVNSQSLQHAIINMETSYKNFFKGSGFPKFKSKHKGNQSFIVPQSIKLEDNKLFIPKFKKGIEIVLHRPIKGEIKSVTISKTSTGKYFASILCETGDVCLSKKPIKENTTRGIDLGIKTFAVTSDGKEYENPKYLKKAMSKLKFVQRKYSKHKGKKTKLKLSKLHEKVANSRKDYLHKVSSELIRDNQSIAIETLKVSNMVKNHNLAQSISDVGWSMFVTMLEYKADWYGVNILKIGTFAPSSKSCSNCGTINHELTLKDRSWTCSKCKVTHDRDLNAAKNIKTFGLKNILSGTDRKTHVELPTLVGALTHGV